MKQTEPAAERTARHLQSLYVVGAGLGVGFALEGMISGGENLSMDWKTSLVVFAFLATLVPFFHGAMLYMDEELTGSPSMMVDFLALFGQTVLFFVMAEFVREPTSFAWAWIALLALDVAWIVWLVSPYANRGRAEQARERRRQYLPWSLINLACIGLLLLVLALKEPMGSGWLLAWVLAAIALARTIADYYFGKKVYFPS